VATYPSDGDDARTLLDAADRAMYVGKAKGRNVVVVAQERPPVAMDPERSAHRAH